MFRGLEERNHRLMAHVVRAIRAKYCRAVRRVFVSEEVGGDLVGMRFWGLVLKTL